MLLNKQKTLTVDGRKRKACIVDKILYQSMKTELLLHPYMSVLPLMKKYVMMFQGKDTLIHELHHHQLETFTGFLACYIKQSIWWGNRQRHYSQ